LRLAREADQRRADKARSADPRSADPRGGTRGAPRVSPSERDELRALVDEALRES